MSNYTKTTDFSAKDALASGDPEKLAVGADVDAEFDSIAVAVATKEDTANKGAASGYCPLTAGTKVADSYLTSNVMLLNTAQSVASGKGDTTVTLTDATTIAVDAALGNTFIVTLTASRVMGEPSNPLDGQTAVFIVVQGGSGSYALTWNAVYLWPSGVAPTLTTTVGAVDMFVGKYNLALDKWLMVTSGLAFA